LEHLVKSHQRRSARLVLRSHAALWYTLLVRGAITAYFTGRKAAPRGELSVKKYKMKTHKGTAKRIKITATGLLMRQQAGKTKYRRKKRGEILHSLHRQVSVAASDAKRVLRSLPYAR
jgi:large subunit ribosomal protein L35